jgi:hypothetical protein
MAHYTSIRWWPVYDPAHDWRGAFRAGVIVVGLVPVVLTLLAVLSNMRLVLHRMTAASVARIVRSLACPLGFRRLHLGFRKVQQFHPLVVFDEGFAISNVKEIMRHGQIAAG